MNNTKNIPCISVTFTFRLFTIWLLPGASQHLSFIGIFSVIHLFINPDSSIRCSLNYQKKKKKKRRFNSIHRLLFYNEIKTVKKKNDSWTSILQKSTYNLLRVNDRQIRTAVRDDHSDRLVEKLVHAQGEMAATGQQEILPHQEPISRRTS